MVVDLAVCVPRNPAFWDVTCSRLFRPPICRSRSGDAFRSPPDGSAHEAGLTGVRALAPQLHGWRWERPPSIAGQHVGRAPGFFFSSAAAVPQDDTEGHFLTSGTLGLCDGPYGFVKAIREAMKRRVDKISSTSRAAPWAPDWDTAVAFVLLKDAREAGICDLPQVSSSYGAPHQPRGRAECDPPGAPPRIEHGVHHGTPSAMSCPEARRLVRANADHSAT